MANFIPDQPPKIAHSRGSSYTASFLSCGLEETQQSVKLRTVVCSWQYVEGAFSVNPEVMLDLFEELHIDTRNIFTMGTLNKLFEWHVHNSSEEGTMTLKESSVASAELLLKP